jgi:hypothetical protein
LQEPLPLPDELAGGLLPLLLEQAVATSASTASAATDKVALPIVLTRVYPLLI